MSETSVVHATIGIERTFDAVPARVFAAFADPEEKRQWCAVSGDETAKFELDFCIGGREMNCGRPEGGPGFVFDGRYQDIVINERIILSGDMHVDGKRVSVSLITVEFRPDSAGTHLIFTEQGAFLEGRESANERESGTRAGLDALVRYLAANP